MIVQRVLRAGPLQTPPQQRIPNERDAIAAQAEFARSPLVRRSNETPARLLRESRGRALLFRLTNQPVRLTVARGLACAAANHPLYDDCCCSLATRRFKRALSPVSVAISSNEPYLLCFSLHPPTSSFTLIILFLK